MKPFTLDEMSTVSPMAARESAGVMRKMRRNHSRVGSRRAPNRP